MEGDNQNLGISTSNGIPMNSRWNPTKEQISMLESFYKQGIRTPTAEQIQQITSRLKAYGQIEGKNVFYWFQNHKARQRQKQKQENLAYMNHHYLHKSQPLFPPPPPCLNVACSPYYLSYPEVGYYSQYQKVLLPADGLRRRPRTEKMEKMKTVSSAGYGYNAMSVYQSGYLDDSMINTSTKFNINCQETLPLFPLQPTGILHGKAAASSPASSENFPTPTSSEGTGMEEIRSKGQIFYDFFSGQGSCESD